VVRPPPKGRQPLPPLGCRFYKNAHGTEPVRLWIKGLPKPVRDEIGADISQVQWDWPIGKPLVDGFGDGLYEVRAALDGNIYRVLFCFKDRNMVLLHGFVKKTQKTSTRDIDIARKRQKETK
jgi:phage-related protein